MNRFFGILIVIIGSNAAFCQELKGPEADTKIILNNIVQFSEYVMHQQPEKIALAYTENAKIFPAGTEIIAGRKAIREYWTPKGSNKTVYHKIIPVEIEVVGDTAYDYGRYEGRTQRGDGSESSWKGKYVIVWKKINDQWLIELDCWNAINP